MDTALNRFSLGSKDFRGKVVLRSAFEDNTMSLKPPARFVAALRKDGTAAGKVFGTIHVVLLTIAFQRSDNHACDLDGGGSGSVSEMKSPKYPVCREGEKGEKQSREENSTAPPLDKLPNCHRDAPRTLRPA